MKLKVIGGYHAGQVVEVPDNYSRGMVCNLTEKQTKCPLRMTRMPTGEANDAVIQYHSYTVELLYTAEGSKHIYLLANGVDIITELLEGYRKEQR